MYALFFAGIVTSVVSMFLCPLSLYTRWAALPISVLAFLSALCTTVASVLATAMWIIFADKVTAATEVNIGVKIGTQMFAFMWIASAAGILAWLVQMGLCCCCASRRDVKSGRKMGSRKAYSGEFSGFNEKPRNRRRMPWKKQVATA